MHWSVGRLEQSEKNTPLEADSRCKRFLIKVLEVLLSNPWKKIGEPYQITGIAQDDIEQVVEGILCGQYRCELIKSYYWKRWEMYAKMFDSVLTGQSYSQIRQISLFVHMKISKIVRQFQNLTWTGLWESIQWVPRR